MQAKGISFLEPGDIFVTKGDIFSSDENYDNVNQHIKGKGHAEVYIGYDYKNKTYKNVNIGEKSGIQNLGLGTKIGNGKRTFGWGQVKYRFPQIIHFKYIDSEKCF